jgi:hypothetical protein
MLQKIILANFAGCLFPEIETSLNFYAASDFFKIKICTHSFGNNHCISFCDTYC